MDEEFPLSRNLKQREIQQTLLQFGILPKIARDGAQVELRNFSPEELLMIFSKLQQYGRDLKTFDFASTNVLSNISNSFRGIGTFTATSAISSITDNFFGMGLSTWLKPPLELMKRSANERLALCVNASGEWALLHDGYFAISHVWEEGIQADRQNRGIPLANVQQIIQRIQQVNAEWIWLDGLAIPGSSRTLTLEEEEIKIAIINNLADIYRRAKAVIIFDALVMQLQSTDYVDVGVCLACGKWMTRLWTYQEIYLAKKALVLTATGVVDFVDISKRLCVLSGNENEHHDILGSIPNYLTTLTTEERDPDKYEKLYLKLVRLVGIHRKKPSLGQIAMSCMDRRTGNEIDYARAFFPVLGLTWRSNLTREEGMELIYAEQPENAKRLLLMPGSPRSSFRPGWAPSYLTGLTAGTIGPHPVFGDIKWEKRGLKRDWYTYKVKNTRPTERRNGLLLTVEGIGSDELCGCLLSSNERPESINALQEVITRQAAYILTNEQMIIPSRNGLACIGMIVERNQDVVDVNEAWVYITVEIALDKSLTANPTSWLILHESPISTHDHSGKTFSQMARFLSDETALHGNLSPVHLAAQVGDESTLKTLLTTNKQNVIAQDDKGWTPLHTAAFHGQVPSIQLLLENGAPIDAEDFSERSPLMLAADEGRTEAVQRLVNYGADVNYSNTNALCPLIQAMMRDHFETAQVLLEAGANPNGKDKFGFYPMMTACRHNVKFMELLIRAGGDPSAKMVGDATSLHFAARVGNAPVLDLLLNLGLPVDMAEGSVSNEKNALYLAIEEQHEAAVNTLLSHGANPNYSITTTWTCVLLAASIGNYMIMKMLIDRGADRNTTCQPENWTALHIAAREGHRLIVKALLAAGWNVNARDASGATPLQTARSAEQTSVMQIIQEAGGN